MTQNTRHIYDRDFAAWALDQSRALRQGRFDAVDREILANELERMVSRERSEINRRIESLTVQLLMWTVQPAVRNEVFQTAILDQRTSVETLLRASPSLRPGIETGLPRTYAVAIDTAEQAGVPRSTFPTEPVFSLDQLIDRSFWPASIFGNKAFMF